MDIAVELYPEVEAWLRQQRDNDLIDSFYRRLNVPQKEPLKCSEAVSDPTLSRYMLRLFAFGKRGDYLAVFRYDLGKSRIRVLECRRLKPPQR